MKEQLKRRNISGIYIFDTFPNEDTDCMGSFERMAEWGLIRPSIH